MRKIVALGGNALGNTPVEQQANIAKTIKKMERILVEDELIITHGNGPQVGIINLAFEDSYENKDIPYMPLPESGAMSQGYIGYHIVKEIRETFRNLDIDKKVSALVTQVKVDEKDPYLVNPTKPIGLFYNKEMADFLSEKNNESFVEDSGRGYRKVVASPHPLEIEELSTIKLLLDNNHVVICCGGGGIPVLKQNPLVGVNGVIDKDNVSSLLATNVDADELIILTAVDKVSINFNKENQEDISVLTVNDAKKYILENQFAKGSMLPKIESAIRFVEGTDKKAYITSLDNINSLDKGTLIIDK